MKKQRVDVPDFEAKAMETVLPVKKKKLSALPGLAALKPEQRKTLLIFTAVVAIALYFAFPSFRNTTVQPLSEETTGEKFADASISTEGSQAGQTTSDLEAKANRQKAESDEAAFGVENGFSGMQNVAYGDWLSVNEPAQENSEPFTPTFSPASPQRQHNPGATPENNERIESLNAAFNAGMAESKSRTFTPTEVAVRDSSSQSGTYGKSQKAEIAKSNIKDAESPQLQQATYTPRHLLPGDVLVCQLNKAINSDVSRETTCRVHGTRLDGGRVTLTVKREKDYVYLEGTNLVFGNHFIQIQKAIAVDTGDVAANGLRDDVDYHRLVRYSALMLAGAGTAISELVGQPQSRQTTTSTTSTYETIRASESDIIKAALAKPADLAADHLLEVFKTPPTVYLEKDKIVHIYFASAVTAPWMPDLSSKQESTFKYRTY